MPVFGTMSDLGEQEFNEEELPFLQLVSKKITRDTQAPGKYRGGQGYQMIVAIPRPRSARGASAADRSRAVRVHVQHDIATIMNERPFEGATYSAHHMGMGFELSKRGELYMISQGAGAGYGDYLERVPEAVIQDVEDALISRQFARDFYKIVFDEATLAIDQERTREVREAERQARRHRGVPFKDFVQGWTRAEPPAHLPFYGAWGADHSILYAGGPHDKRQASEPRPVFMPKPREVRIAELEQRNADLEQALRKYRENDLR